MPDNHFTETDLHAEWKKFLAKLRTTDIVIYNAVAGFKLTKEDENDILVHYPSDTAKAEFDKVSGDFFNYFKIKVHNHKIRVSYRCDFVSLKKEIVTKRSVFENYVKINPLLKELDDLFKFDFS